MSNVTDTESAGDYLSLVNWYDPQERDEGAALFDDEERRDRPAGEDSAADEEVLQARVALKNRSTLTPRIKALRRLARESAVNIKQRTIFLSAAELDEMRKPAEQIGLAKLFEAWCLKGNENWLNPIAELKPVTDNLRNFGGRARALRPIVFLLLQLARGGISPAEFVRYVVIPRMAFDHDWRRWRERHYWALNRIAEVLIEMRGKTPFAGRYLGEGKTLTDIVLVKYVGKPLARFPAHVLEDEALMSKYQAGWRRLRLANPVFLLFLRTNVFPFLYRLSGRVDLIQLVPIVSYAAELERRFDRAFPQHDESTVSDIFSVSLYTDFEDNMMARQKKGLTTFSLVREIKAYLRIIRTLIDSNAGIYLSGYFAALLRSVLDPDAAETLARALPRIRDTGGMHAYRWHARRLVALEPHEREQFLAEVDQHRGLHPLYPYRSPDRLFVPPATEHEARECRRLAEQLRLDLELNQRTRYRALRDAARGQNAERKPVIDGCVADILSGKDRRWSETQVKFYDSLGPALHELLLRATIPGIGCGYSRGALKARSFAELFNRYRDALKLQGLEITHQASLPHRPLRDTGPPQNAKLRERVRFTMLRHGAETLLETGSPPPLQEFIRLLNRRGQELDDEVRELREQEINKGESGAGRKVHSLKAQRARIESVFTAWEELSEDEQFVTVIIVAARVAARGDELETFAVSQFLSRYSEWEAVAERLEYLRQDLAPERMTLRQLGYAINTLETMLLAAREEWCGPNSVFPAGENLNAATLAFTTLRRETTTPEAFELAARSLLALPQIETERATWRDLQDQLSGANPELKTLTFAASKSPTDAYFGEMGATSWAEEPELITRPGFQIVRIGDKGSGQLIGAAALHYARSGIPSLGITSFFAAYGFTLIRECLSTWGRKQWMFAYFQFRWLLEQISLRTGLPIFLPGLGSPAIVSGAPELAELIVRYERWTGAAEAQDAAMPQAYYSPQAFQRGLLIIDPRNDRGFRAEESIANLKLS